jgi:hypothetical protein
MTPNFTFYRVLCTSPPDLEDEREVFETAVARFVEEVSMPDRVLFAPASLRPPIVASRQKQAIEANIRCCEFVLAVFGERWPDPVFGGFAAYAAECAREAGAGTRAVAVCFRNYAGAAPEVRALRESLAGCEGCELHDFVGAGDFGRLVGDLLSRWYGPLRPQPAE